MERADADLDSEERPMLADRVSSHKSRHFKHRRRKKSYFLHLSLNSWQFIR